jgi:hypothetical protein
MARLEELDDRFREAPAGLLRPRDEGSYWGLPSCLQDHAVPTDQWRRWREHECAADFGPHDRAVDQGRSQQIGSARIDPDCADFEHGPFGGSRVTVGGPGRRSIAPRWLRSRHLGCRSSPSPGDGAKRPIGEPISPDSA